MRQPAYPFTSSSTDAFSDKSQGRQQQPVRRWSRAAPEPDSQQQTLEQTAQHEVRPFRDPRCARQN
jgi:hypothetical protein